MKKVMNITFHFCQYIPVNPTHWTFMMDFLKFNLIFQVWTPKLQALKLIIYSDFNLLCQIGS